MNQAFAKKFWPKQDAVGKRIVMGGISEHPNWITIVGVVGDVRHFGLDIDPKPEMYVPFAQDPYFTTIYVVRSNQDPRSLLPAIRREIQRLDPAQPIHGVSTFAEIVQRSMTLERVASFMTGFFAFAAVHYAIQWWFSRNERVLLVFSIQCAVYAAFCGAIVSFFRATTVQ